MRDACYEKGKQARLQGIPLQENPFKGTNYAYTWSLGWLEQQYKDLIEPSLVKLEFE